MLQVQKKILWGNEYERRVVRYNFGNVTEEPDFPHKFLKLIKGLDSSSVNCINRILIRQKTYLNTNKKNINLFSTEEQIQLRQLKEEFESQIFEVSEDIFAYKNYLLPINHFEPSVFYYKHGIEEISNVHSLKGKIIIDVGGFIGDSVLIFAELSPKEIYTFEAVPENYALMQKTFLLNDIKNVVSENYALGAQKGFCNIQVCGSGSSPIDRKGLNYTGQISVPQVTLDDYVEEKQLDNIGLIKVDIEGGEPNFLRGAIKTIHQQKPILLISIYHNSHDFFNLKPMIESWDLGYKFKIHKPIISNTTSETLLIAEVK